VTVCFGKVRCVPSLLFLALLSSLCSLLQSDSDDKTGAEGSGPVQPLRILLKELSQSLSCQFLFTRTEAASFCVQPDSFAPFVSTNESGRYSRLECFPLQHNTISLGSSPLKGLRSIVVPLFKFAGKDFVLTTSLLPRGFFLTSSLI
jgi:hypothetical protein